MYMIAIIVCAFSTIFYTFSCNLTDKERQTRPYIKAYSNIRIVDAILTVYFIAVGEFYYDNYKERPNNYIIWPMFVICNFFMMVIFMNMLIAIMS